LVCPFEKGLDFRGRASLLAIYRGTPEEGEAEKGNVQRAKSKSSSSSVPHMKPMREAACPYSEFSLCKGLEDAKGFLVGARVLRPAQS
jgi:hypothetical protein